MAGKFASQRVDGHVTVDPHRVRLEVQRQPRRRQDIGTVLWLTARCHIGDDLDSLNEVNVARFDG